MSSRSSARERAFAIPELFEAILVQLPQRELLLAQRISPQFHEAIASSPTLLQLLFFRPAPINGPRKQEAGLLHRIPLHHSAKDESPKKWTLNPLLREHFVPWFVIPESKEDMPQCESIEMLDGFQDDARREAFLRKEASWRKMLLFHPSPASLSIVRISHGMAGTSVRETSGPFADSDAAGVTMGVVYDITESFFCARPVSSFCLSVSCADDVPAVTLYLSCVLQCCPTHRGNKWDLRSLGAELSEQELAIRERDTPSKRKSIRNGLYRFWESDLTVEQGGIDAAKFEGWQRERAPISSLRSDVR